MKWSFIQNNGLMSKIKQPHKNWINDHNFNKDLTFKIMEKKKYRKTNVPFNCQQPWLLGSSIPCRDSSSSLRRHILPRRVVLVESSSRWVVVVESSSRSYGASSSHLRRANFHLQIIRHIWLTEKFAFTSDAFLQARFSNATKTSGVHFFYKSSSFSLEN